jgi:tRNA-dihydrouridine synthase
MLERVETCRKHFESSIRWKGEKTGIFEMRRHYAGYFKSLDHFKEFRIRLVHADSAIEVSDILEEILHKYHPEWV